MEQQKGSVTDDATEDTEMRRPDFTSFSGRLTQFREKITRFRETYVDLTRSQADELTIMEVSINGWLSAIKQWQASYDCSARALQATYKYHDKKADIRELCESCEQGIRSIVKSHREAVAQLGEYEERLEFLPTVIVQAAGNSTHCELTPVEFDVDMDTGPRSLFAK